MGHYSIVINIVCDLSEVKKKRFGDIKIAQRLVKS